MTYEERCEEINSYLAQKMVFHARAALSTLIKELGYE